MELEPKEQQQLEDYQEMMGIEAGQLALALDNLTDVIALLGQHQMYCRAGKTPQDLNQMMRTVEKAKALVQQSLLRLREQSSD